MICVVEKPSDVNYIEEGGVFRGHYHILGAIISPLDGIRAEDCRIQELITRTKKDTVFEIIFALNPSIESATTINLISSLLPGIKCTQLASGLAAGGMIEFTDTRTIYHAFQNRTEIRQ